jgi:hypothetical protein
MPVNPPTGMPGITGEVVIVPLGLTVEPPPKIDAPVLPDTPTGRVVAGVVTKLVGVVTVVVVGCTALMFSTQELVAGSQ